MRKEKREKVKKSKDEGVNRQRMSKNGKGYPGPMRGPVPAQRVRLDWTDASYYSHLAGYVAHVRVCLMNRR